MQREEKKQMGTLKELVNKEILSVSSRKRTVPCFSFGACHRHVYRGCPLSQHRPGSSRCLRIHLSPVFLWLCLYPFTAWCPCKYGMILKVFALFRISCLHWTLDWSSLCDYALIINDLPVLRLHVDLKPLQLNYVGDINMQGAKLTTVKCDGTLFARFMGEVQQHLTNSYIFHFYLTFLQTYFVQIPDLWFWINIHILYLYLWWTALDPNLHLILKKFEWMKRSTVGDNFTRGWTGNND